MSPDYTWNLALGPLTLAAAALLLYVPRWRHVRRHVGARAAPTWRLVSFVTGALTLVMATASPIDALGEQAFLMHMVQHLLLLDAVPILMVLGLTKVLLRPATRRLMALERALGPVGHPVAAVVVYVAVMGAWHLPALYDAAVRSPTLHVIEHVSFTFGGALYWWHLLSPIRGRARRGTMDLVLYMTSTKVLVGLLGILLTFSPSAVYDVYRDGVIWGMSPTDDQATGGALMALEQSVIMGVALAWLFVRALADSDRAEERAERVERARSAQRS